MQPPAPNTKMLPGCGVVAYLTQAPGPNMQRGNLTHQISRLALDPSADQAATALEQLSAACSSARPLVPMRPTHVSYWYLAR
jgi:hypothetical protein